MDMYTEDRDRKKTPSKHAHHEKESNDEQTSIQFGD